jgi:hypothetical protein
MKDGREVSIFRLSARSIPIFREEYWSAIFRGVSQHLNGVRHSGLCRTGVAFECEQY